MKRLVVIGLFLMLMVSCMNAATEPSTYETSTTQEQQVEEPDYIFVEEPRMVKDGYSTIITGILKNNTGREQSYVDISFTLYDADGNNIGVAYATGANLKPDGTWKFEAFVIEDNVATFELERID